MQDKQSAVEADSNTAMTILEFLRRTRAESRGVASNSAPGVYGIFATELCNLPELDIPSSRLLYLGQTNDLKARDHFNAAHSGFHTLRRTLGAILKEQLRLSAEPRSMGRSKSNYNCYRFSDEGERQLTEWMVENLELAVYPHSGDVAALETLLIEAGCPPLNLTMWRNPQRDHLRKLRSLCREEAKRRWLQ